MRFFRRPWEFSLAGYLCVSEIRGLCAIDVINSPAVSLSSIHSGSALLLGDFGLIQAKTRSTGRRHPGIAGSASAIWPTLNTVGRSGVSAR
jgi:hypothetical protein